MAAEQMSVEDIVPGKGDATSGRRPRLVFNLDDAQVAVKVLCPGEWGEQELTFPITGELNPVARHLALMGLSEYLSRSAKGEDRATKLANAYQRLIDEGMDAFAPKERPKTPRMPSRRRRVQALAALYGTTVDFINSKLKDKTPEEQEHILTNERVVSKALEMVQAEKEAAVDL